MIADEYGVAQSTISRWLKRAWQERVNPAAEQLREYELDKLDRIERILLAILDQPHPRLDRGRIAVDSEGEPMPDPAPILAAADRLIRLALARAEIAGFKAPVKVQGELTAPPTLDPRVSALIAAAQEQSERARQEILDANGSESVGPS